MYSFYGGRPGNSFVIITTFRSVQDMIDHFQDGPGYTEVHFDEYVMINSDNKNDPDNGSIYKRGYDFNNEMGGAEYIGTIVGPAGKAPMLEMTTHLNVLTKYLEDKNNEEAYENRYTTGGYTRGNGGLVPGKTDNGVYNDTVTWSCYSVRDSNGEDCTAYIGFLVPYLVLELTARSVSPYVDGVYSENAGGITRIDGGNHPFYEQWQIDIPKGIRGNGCRDLRIETAHKDIAYPAQLAYRKSDDIANEKKVLTYEQISYDTYQTGKSQRFYLGDYNMIEDVSLDNDGTLKIKYVNKDETAFDKKIKWINNITLNPDQEGCYKLHVIWNDGTSQDVGSIIAPVTWGSTASIGNLHWTGVGVLSDDGSSGGYKKLVFTINPIGDIAADVAHIYAAGGTLKATSISSGLSIADQSILPNHTLIQSEFSGLRFIITTTQPTLYPHDEMVAISISGMTLTFHTEQENP